MSAGHCTKYIFYMQFNEDSQGTFKNENIYEVDRKSLTSFENGGTDFAVFKLEENYLTDKTPVEVQGHYQVRFEKISVGDSISITGYGKDSDPNQSYRQQFHHGSLTNDFGIKIYHDVDTENGNSGTSIAGSAMFKKAVEKCLLSE